MGRPRLKVIDDSQIESKENKIKPRKSEVKDELVEKLKAELDSDKAKEVRGDGEEAPRETEPTPLRQSSAGQAEPAPAKKPATAKKSTTSSKPKPRGKKYQEVIKKLDRTRTYPLNEAVELAKKASFSKFDGTLEAHINTVQTGIRGLVSLPYASGKKLRILAFGPSADSTGSPQAPSGQAKELEGVGAVVGDDKAIEEIAKGKVDFDLVITTPEWMPKLAKVAKVLGPKGLMPNPKNGTITEDLKKAAESFQSGKTEYKTELKAPVIHLGLGKLTQPTEELAANIKTLLSTIGKSKIKKVTLAPTMGPSVKLDLGSI